MYDQINLLVHFLIITIVSFIPYFRLLVFGILVTLVAWFSFQFFPSCPPCLAKCKQRLHIFVTSSPKVTKNQKRKIGWTKHLSLKKGTKLPTVNRWSLEGADHRKMGLQSLRPPGRHHYHLKKMDSKTGKLVYRELFFQILLLLRQNFTGAVASCGLGLFPFHKFFTSNSMFWKMTQSTAAH